MTILFTLFPAFHQRVSSNTAMDQLVEIIRELTDSSTETKTKVHPFPEVKSFTRILEPIWKLTYWIGVLPDWCYSPPRSQCSKIFNRIAVFVSVLTLTLHTGYATFDLINISRRVASRSIIYRVVSYFPHLTAAIFSVYILLKRNKFLNFFSLWNQLERNPLIQKHRKFSKSEDYIVRFLVIASSLINVMLLVFIITNSTSFSVLANHPELINIFTRPVLLVFQSLTTTYMIVVSVVSAIIPVLVSCQTGSIVEALESATKKIFEDLEPSRLRSSGKSTCNQFHELWSLRETASQSERSQQFVRIPRDRRARSLLHFNLRVYRRRSTQL